MKRLFALILAFAFNWAHGATAIPNVFATMPSGNVPASYLDVNFALTANYNTFSNYLVDTGVANVYVVTLPANTTASLAAGLAIQFKASADNSGASTLNVNAMGAKNITNYDASALTAGQIKNGGIVSVIYDGTQFKLAGQPGGVTPSGLAPIATNTVLGNATAGAASPTALAVGTCSTASSAVIWTTNTGFGCNTSITAAAVPVGGITGLGTGVATALAINVGSAGAPVVFNGAGGTPSSITLTNASGTAASLTAGAATTAGTVTTAAQPNITSLGTLSSLAITGMTTSGGYTVNTSLPVAGSIAKTANAGVVLQGTTGATYDFALLTPGGANVLTVPTGTANATLAGQLSTAGVTITAGGTAVAGSITKAVGGGLVVQSVGGSSFDYSLLTPTGTNIFNVPTGTTNATLAGQLSTAGLTVTGGTSVAGSIAKTANAGVVLQGATGATYDYALLGPGGASIQTVATGTVNTNFYGNISINGVLIISATAPTIASGFGTSPSIIANNTAAFKVTVGSGGTDYLGSFTMPAAPNGWACTAHELGVAASLIQQVGVSSTNIQLHSFNSQTGANLPFGAGNTIFVQCTAF